jgi:hypothetical protein
VPLTGLGTYLTYPATSPAGFLSRDLSSLLVEKDLEKELDPQIAEIGERLERMERLLENLQPSQGDGDRHDAL